MHVELEMTEFIVREARESEEAARRVIVDAATLELRRTYRPRENENKCGDEPNDVLVALKESVLVGTAEYIRRQDHIYIQGIAVHPEYRAQGVCRALVLAARRIAKQNNLAALTLCAIEETGNVEIFERLGFKITSHAAALNHVNPEGGTVTQVEMEQKIA